MSQYFTYNDFQGRLPTDALTSQPECKTCSKPSCYNTYENVQGISTSKHGYTASFALGDNDLKPMDNQVCDVTMIGCVPANIENTDPYNVTVKSISKCDPSKASYYNIVLPVVDGSLDKNKRESSRYTSSRSYNNNSRTAANVDIYDFEYPNYTLNADQKIPLTANGMYSKKSISVDGKISNRFASTNSSVAKLSLSSAQSGAKLSLSSAQSGAKLSLSSAQSGAKLSPSPASVVKLSAPSVAKLSTTSRSTTKSNKIPISIPIGKKKKLVDEYDFESFISQLNL